MEQKVKQRYVIVVEGLAPVKAEFQVMAEDEHEALKMLDNPRLLTLRQRPDVDLARLRRQKATIKEGLSSLIKMVKNF